MANEMDPADEPIVLTLPDGSERRVPAGTLAREVVGSSGPRLLRDAIAVTVGDSIQDLMTPLRRSGPFRVIMQKDA